jgi:ribokinase
MAGSMTRSVERLAAPSVDALDTTGAGDAFVGAFAVGLAAGLAPIAAVRLAIRCASDSVTRHGTQSSFASRANATRMLAEARAVS